MVTCELRAEILSIHGQKLNGWVGILLWVARNLETRSDDMLAWSFLCAGGVGGKRADRVSRLCRVEQEF